MQDEQDLRLGVDETCFVWLRGEEILINSVLYLKKMLRYVTVCTEKGVSKNSFLVIFSKENNRAFKER